MAQKTIAELQAIFITGAKPTQQDFADLIESSVRSDKIYSATLNQTGGSDPVAVEGINTIGAIVWTRVDATRCEGILSGAFPVNKTHVLVSNGQPIVIGAYRNDDNTIRLNAATDGDIQNATILIWVDP